MQKFLCGVFVLGCAIILGWRSTQNDHRAKDRCYFAATAGVEICSCVAHHGWARNTTNEPKNIAFVLQGVYKKRGKTTTHFVWAGALNIPPQSTISSSNLYPTHNRHVYIYDQKYNQLGIIPPPAKEQANTCVGL